jgi:hypothetical protein
MSLPGPHELTEYIQFFNATGKKSAAGIMQTTTRVADAWARIEEIGGSLEVLDQKHQAQIIEYEIITQYIDGITGFMAILWGNKQLEIVSPPPQKLFDMNRRAWLSIRAQRIDEFGV